MRGGGGGGGPHRLKAFGAIEVNSDRGVKKTRKRNATFCLIVQKSTRAARLLGGEQRWWGRVQREDVADVAGMKR